MQMKFSKIYTLALIMLVTIVSCDDMNSIHEEYLNGEQVYTGKLDSINVVSGFERVKITGNTQYLGNSQQIVVSWDDQEQIFDIDQNQIVNKKYEFILDNLNERNYEFTFLTTDEDNNQSIKKTVSGRAFGDVFIAGQTARRVTGFDVESGNNLIMWANKAESEYVVYTTIRYENNSDTMTEAVVNPDDSETELIDWKHGGRLEIISTVISGENGFDTADLDLVESTLPIPPSGLNRDWTLAATIQVDKEFFGGVGGAEGSPKAIDGDIFTKYLILDHYPEFWMQQTLPNPGIVNKYTLTSGNDAAGRDPRDWELVGSNDETNWVTLDTRVGESFSGRNETNEYSFTSDTPYRYYRMNITSLSGDPHFQISEWRLYESDVSEIDYTGYLLETLTVSNENGGGQNAGEGSPKVVDGDTNTKYLYDYVANSWMQQGFLNSDKERTVRVRLTDEFGFLTIKGLSSKDGLSRFEWEKEISKTEAEALFNLCEKGMINKTRYLIKAGNHTIEVDEFFDNNEGLIVAEIELNHTTEIFKKPVWLGEEVTGNSNYYNSQLSKNPFKNW